MFTSTRVVLAMTPPPNPNIMRCLLGAIALIGLPHFWTVALSVLIFFYALLIWRALAVWQPKLLPKRGLLLLVTCAGIAILLQCKLGLVGRDAGTHIFLIALGLKLLEIKGKRDLYFVVFLSFIVAAALFLYQQSLVMALYIGGVCIGLLALLVSINMHQLQLRTAVKTALSITLQALPLGLSLFILFPRLETPHWSFLADTSQGQTGLSETLEPGTITELALSDALVFRVKFEGPIVPQSERYWRGPVFSITDGKTWRPLPKRPLSFAGTHFSFNGQAYRYTLLMEPQAHNWVFGLDMPTALPPLLSMNAYYQLHTAADPSLRAEYVLQSYTDYYTGKLSRQEQQENLQLPALISPEISQLVTQLHGFDAAPHVFIQNVLNYFREQPFHYSLTPPLMEQHPLETFLFQTRTGFCSHYATAFTYLMRVAHIPARVVGGYQGGEYNPVGNFLEIRQADAHAWSEVWLNHRGWVRIDPTAVVAPERVNNGVNIERQIAEGALNFDPNRQHTAIQQLARQLRQTWQNADYSWQRWVINYHNQKQANFLAAFGLNNSFNMLLWLLLTSAVLTSLLFWWLMRQPAKQQEQAVYWYQRFIAKLKKLPLDKHPTETASTFALRVSQKAPNLAAATHSITTLYLELRYSEESTPQTLEQLKTQVRAFKVNNRCVS